MAESAPSVFFCGNVCGIVNIREFCEIWQLHLCEEWDKMKKMLYTV